MDRAQLIERLMATFLGELGEHARAMNEDLLALEKSPADPERDGRFKSLFRSAHSLKGAARSVSVGLIEEACHSLESILASARDDTGVLGPDLFALLFEAADAIEDGGVRLRERKDLSDSSLAAILPRLQLAAAAALTPAAPAPAGPSPARARSPAIPATAPSRGVPQRETAPSHDPHPVTGAADPPPSERASRVVPGRDRQPDRPENPRATTVPTADAARSPGGVGFVRLPAEKLDALLTWSGELLVARRRIESQAGELETLRDLVERWADEWRGLTGPTVKLMRRIEGGRGPADQLPRRAAAALRLARERVLELEEKLGTLTRVTAENGRQLARAAGRLDEEVRRARMLPFADACQGLDRTVRDVALSAGKSLELVVEGGEVELDRSVLEWLKDPLTHLVRNAVDHGIEPPDRRITAGKTPAGRVTISARLRGDLVEVVVADDGGGLDYERLRREARARDIAEPTGEQGLTELIFLPGFTTAPAVTKVSGRGVGLDVVKSRLEGLHGTIDVGSVPGQGTRFTLSVPLTLTAMRALLVRSERQVFALASASVQRLTRVDPADLRPVGGRPVLLEDGQPVPVASLAEALGIDRREPAPEEARKRPVVVVAAGDRRMAFLVDELLAEQEIIIKSLGARVRGVRNVSGATILPSGKIALVLNAVNLVRASLGRAPAALPHVARSESHPARKRLLVVDDSVTPRTLEKTILEAAGYEVAIAVDGEDGWRVLQERGADLVVCDIEMPRMDGFALTETIRSSPRFTDLPVILFSSRASDRDKARGNEVGADAYIVKGAFDQKQLLETVAQLL